MNKIINGLSSLLVFSLAAVAFVLSFSALADLAATTGAIKARLAWLYPIALDGSIIVFSLAALRASLAGEDTKKAIALVALFTLLSIGLNIYHAPNDMVAQLIAGSVPLVVLLAFETFLGQMKNDVKRGNALMTLDKITSKVTAAHNDLDALTTQANDMTQAITELTTKRDLVTEELTQAKRELTQTKRQMTTADDTLSKANDTRAAQMQSRRNELVSILSGQPGQSYNALADKLGVSPATIKRDVGSLLEAGLLHKNGAGLEVTQ